MNQAYEYVWLIALYASGVFVGSNIHHGDSVKDVAKACSLYGRYYVEAPSNTDPMGYYINCNVTGGPEIAHSTEGKKK